MDLNIEKEYKQYRIKIEASAPRVKNPGIFYTVDQLIVEFSYRTPIIKLLRTNDPGFIGFGIL